MSASALEGVRRQWFRDAVAAGTDVRTREARTQLATEMKKIPELGYGPCYARVDIRLQMLRWLEGMGIAFER